MGKHSLPGSSPWSVFRGVGRLRRSRSRGIKAASVVIALGLAGFGEMAYTVVGGDNLSRIGKRFGVSAAAIAKANQLANPNLIRAGQSLVIPGGAMPAAPPAQGPGATYTVVKGDTLGAIAKKHGTDVATMIRINQLRSARLIRPGQVLNLPGPPAPPSIEQLLVKYATAYGVDPATIKALAWMESGFKQEVVSSKGAIGVMQVLPETGAFTSKHLLREPVDLNNVEHNIKAGTRFFAFLLSKTGGDEKTALAGYFQGLRSVRTTGISARTQWYVDSVTALKGRFAR